MAKNGRPRVMDEMKRREVCALVSVGASVSQAAKYVGCSAATVKREAAREVEFGERLKRAKATASLAPLQAMRAAVQTHWRAAAWMLERTDPKQFGDRKTRQFGARELRALRRDLIDIIKEEIDHPVVRERILKRFQAAINYAMRHAWDSQRTGGQLQAAMQFFANRESDNPWPGDTDWLDAEFPRSASPAPPAQDGPIDNDFKTHPFSADIEDFCRQCDPETIRLPGRNENGPVQKS